MLESIAPALALIKAVSNIWGWLASGGLLCIGLLLAAYCLPQARQLFLGLAGGVALAVWSMGYGALLERAVCNARIKLLEQQAERAASQRDADEAREAAADANRRAAELEIQLRADKETIDEYVKELAARKSPACTLTPDDLPRRR